MASTFVQAAVILLREGLEALLVLAALAAYLDRSGARDRLPALYIGAGIAVFASFVAAWAFETFNNGAHSDILEGIVILIAAALMLYVSGWLLVRQDPRAWQGYLQRKADAALARQTGVAVAMLAFLAVFREGAETVLFVHALAKTAGGWTVELLSGLAVAAAALAILFFAINAVARWLPLRPLFLVTSAFLFIMAIKFIGEAVQEFQEQQLVGYTEIKGGAWLADIGFNPTIEAVGLQLVVIACAVVTFIVMDRRGRHAAAA
jgi:high-affinity iron transporter